MIAIQDLAIGTRLRLKRGGQVVVIDENPGDGVWLIVHAESNPGQSDGDSMAGLSTDSMCHLDDIEDIL